MLIYIYKIITILFTPVIFITILYRTIIGKEEILRLGERFGFNTKHHNQPVIWLHAASLGEAMVALNLVVNMARIYPSYQFLLTTGTRTSANIVMCSKIPNLTHQYTPLDLDFCVNKFLKCWQPKIGIFIESEIWPNLVCNAAAKFPIALVNASISDRSLDKWNYFKVFFNFVASKFNFIITQSDFYTKKFQYLGLKNVFTGGNLKYCNPKPYIKKPESDKLREQTIGRKIIFAASTHQGDEDFMLQSYQALKANYPNLLLIIAPRHPERSAQIKQKIYQQKLKLTIRSKSQIINQQTDIYLVDTIGELGMFYDLADISFIGGSLKNGGHNPIEASFFHNLIIFGPDMSNFIEINNEYQQAGAAIICQNLIDFIQVVEHFFNNPAQIAKYNKAATALVANKNNILRNYLNNITKLIN